ncbi:MAG TPA: TetR/AcrR family transcriptional regulator [Micromonosporaceae bacterium]|jgi:AcrR family transcriptional regulator
MTDTVLETGEARSPRSARLGGVREQEILRAAYELLGEVGYEALRLDAVASRARASKATLYRHWPGKAQLVADAVRVCKASTHECPDTGSLRGDLVAALEIMSASMKSEDGPLFAGLVMAMLNDPEFAAEMRGIQDAKNNIAREIHARAVSRGEIRADSDPHLIDEIAPAQMFMQCFARGEPLDEPFINHLVDDILMPLLTR